MKTDKQFLKAGFYDLEEYFNELNKNFIECQNLESSKRKDKQLDILKSLYTMQDKANVIQIVILDNINKIILKTLNLNNKKAEEL
ncbi:MAG: hypothetical protein ACYCSW_06915 [bacterium]